jgi:hypothetical protein
MQTEMHTAKPFVPEFRASEVEDAIGKLKSSTSPGVDQIPAQQIQKEEKTLLSEIHKLFKYIWKNKNFVTSVKSQLSFRFTRWVIKTDCSNG